MFPDWRKGLAEMARVTRPGGHGAVAIWQKQGAATFLLLGDIRRKLFPGRDGMTIPEGVRSLSDAADFARDLIAAGFRDLQIEAVKSAPWRAIDITSAVDRADRRGAALKDAGPRGQDRLTITLPRWLPRSRY